MAESRKRASRSRPLGAIVLAAGLGTRMRSRRAKVLHELAGKPLIGYPLSILRDMGVDPIVVIVGHQEDAVRAACSPYGVRFARQTEQLGTGHAARMARAALKGFDGDLLLVNGDLPFVRPESYRKLVRAHRGCAVSLLTAEVRDPGEFGRIVRDRHGRVAKIVENRDASESEKAIHEVNVGLYCAESRFLFDALSRLRPNNDQKQLYLTDIIEIAVKRGLAIGDTQGEEIEGTQISSRADLANCETLLRTQLVRKWIDSGVTIEDPATAYIGPDVTLGTDTILGPNVVLRGRTQIGDNCRFDGTSRVVDCTIGSNVHVRLGVVMQDSRIDDGAIIGPFAQLRPETHLKAGVHIGNFVETKKAVVGERTKANHLAYLGDAEIGSDTNIGAGTITCNYDGFRKHKTKIGDRVQVGSDSQLIAPVTVHDDAYIATGTTVRRDVGPGVLYFNPRRDIEREGWVAARRKREGKGSR